MCKARRNYWSCLTRVQSWAHLSRPNRGSIDIAAYLQPTKTLIAPMRLAINAGRGSGLQPDDAGAAPTSSHPFVCHRSHDIQNVINKTNRSAHGSTVHLLSLLGRSWSAEAGRLQVLQVGVPRRSRSAHRALVRGIHMLVCSSSVSVTLILQVPTSLLLNLMQWGVRDPGICPYWPV